MSRYVSQAQVQIQPPEYFTEHLSAFSVQKMQS